MKKENKYYCDICGKELNIKVDHIQEPNPYEEEINNRIITEDLCKNCYDKACDDI